jgi:hypothetical protein
MPQYGDLDPTERRSYFPSLTQPPMPKSWRQYLKTTLITHVLYFVNCILNSSLDRIATREPLTKSFVKGYRFEDIALFLKDVLFTYALPAKSLSLEVYLLYHSSLICRTTLQQSSTVQPRSHPA